MKSNAILLTSISTDATLHSHSPSQIALASHNSLLCPKPLGLEINSITLLPLELVCVIGQLLSYPALVLFTSTAKIYSSLRCEILKKSRHISLNQISAIQHLNSYYCKMGTAFALKSIRALSASFKMKSLIPQQEIQEAFNELLSLLKRSPRLSKLEIDAPVKAHFQQITQLPVALWQLKNLRKLSIFNLPVKWLSPNLGELTKLQTLALHLGESSRLPQAISQLQRLKTLMIDSIDLSSASSLEIWKLTNLTKLGLSNNKISCLPPNIRQLTGLCHLTIKDTYHLQTVSKEIGLLPKLHTLNFSNLHSLTSIPQEISQLTQLRVLKLKGLPKLSAYPLTEKKLPRLRILELVDLPAITDFPTTIWDSSTLQKLTIGLTSLSTIPTQISQLKKLQHLRLVGLVNLTDLPNEIGELTGLRSLSLIGLSKLKLESDTLLKLNSLDKLEIRQSTRED